MQGGECGKRRFAIPHRASSDTQPRTSRIVSYDRVVPNSDPARKSGHAGLGKFLVTKGYGGANGRRVFTFAVAEAGADGELGSVRQAGQQSAHPAFMPASAGLMAQNNRFGVVKRLYFEKGRGASGDIVRSGLSEPQSLAAEGFSF